MLRKLPAIRENPHPPLKFQVRPFFFIHHCLSYLNIFSESTEHTYAVPTKCVKTEGDMMVWMRSEAYYDIVGFINGISLAIQGKRLTDDCPMSATMRNLLEVFTKLNALIDATPPIAQPQRFGNKAYRDWFKKMQDVSVI